MWRKALVLGLVLIAIGMVVGGAAEHGKYALHKYNEAEEKYHHYMGLYRQALLNGDITKAEYYKSLADEYKSEMDSYMVWMGLFGTAAIAGAGSGNLAITGLSLLGMA